LKFLLVGNFNMSILRRQKNSVTELKESSLHKCQIRAIFSKDLKRIVHDNKMNATPRITLTQKRS
jgi:phage FluMu protein gp41